MSRKTFRTFRTIVILLILLISVIYLYVYFNGGDMKKTFIDFAKKQGLYMVMSVIFLTLTLYVLNRIFKIRFWRS